jgi:hypothetical protein
MELIALEKKEWDEIKSDIKEIKNALASHGKMSAPKKWGTASDLEKLLGIKRRTVYHYVSKGIVTAHKVGGVLLFDLEQIGLKIQNE